MIKCFMCKDTQRIAIGGDNSDPSVFVDGYFITASELEQRERQAFESGRKRGQYEIVELRGLCSYSHEDSLVGLPDFNDYLKQRK